MSSVLGSGGRQHLRRPRRGARHHRRAPRGREAWSERCAVVRRPARHRQVRAGPSTRSTSRRSSVLSASRASSRRWPSATPACTSWCSRSSTASMSSPNPNASRSTPCSGRVQHDALDPFLVGLAVLSLVADAARAQPVLVVIDDEQWLDDESAMALSFVGRRLRAERAAFLVTMRGPPDARGRFEGLRRIDLGGLSAPEALDLLTAATGGPVEETVASRIVAATGGNPLALVELPGALTVEQLRGTEPLPDPLPIGERLSGLFAARARALDADAQMVLLLASAERLGEPVLLRRAAAGGRRPVMGRGGREGGSEWPGHVHAERRVPPSARPLRDLLLGLPGRSAPRPRRAGRGARRGRRRRPPRVAPRRRRRRPGRAGRAGVGDVGRASAATRRRVRRGRVPVARRRADARSGAGRRAAPRSSSRRAASVVAARGRARSSIAPGRPDLRHRHRAEAAWTEALIHIVAGNVGEPAALMADALPLIEADEPELAVGACVAADAAVLAGGHLIEESTRRAIAAGTQAVLARCDLPDPIAQVVAGVAIRLIDRTRRRGARCCALPSPQPPEIKHAFSRSPVATSKSSTSTPLLAAAEVLDDRALGRPGRCMGAARASQPVRSPRCRSR